MLKFDFSVRTREGQKIASIVIMGFDRPDAERKLYQMYRQCEILRCELKLPVERRRAMRTTHAAAIDDVLAITPADSLFP